MSDTRPRAQKIWSSGNNAYESQYAKDLENTVLNEFTSYNPPSHSDLFSPATLVGGFRVPEGTAGALIDGVWYWRMN